MLFATLSLNVLDFLSVVASYTYDPWGKIISSSGTLADINPLRYRGYYYDSETGFYYLSRAIMILRSAAS